ncbi:hypothetical protein Zmor_007629 [Zophobas morio]|uniref:7tm 6 domain containing protein n=1 Tax=Zophobas morio TaxID=2755281 RepID=A0AA38J023_9CUCU|nr:hypothetical protein Zmor_007629 [Zophobas morio]
MFDWVKIISLNIFVLQKVGMWPKQDKQLGCNCHTLYILIAVILLIDGSIVFQLIHMALEHSTLESLTRNIFMLMTEILGSIKMFYFIRNVKTVKELVQSLEDELFQPRTTQQVNSVRPDLKLWKKTYATFCSLTTSTAFIWSLYPLVDQSFLKFRLPLEARYPFEITTLPLYFIIYFHQVAALFLVAIGALHVDTLNAALMVLAGAQCDILCQNLKALENKALTYNQKLIQCIKHHKKILSFAEKTNQFFSTIVLGQYFTTSVSTGIAMFRLSLVDPLSSESYSLLFFVSAVTVQLFSYCWFGNEVEVKVRLFQI